MSEEIKAIVLGGEYGVRVMNVTRDEDGNIRLGEPDPKCWVNSCYSDDPPTDKRGVWKRMEELGEDEVVGDSRWVGNEIEWFVEEEPPKVELWENTDCIEIKLCGDYGCRVTKLSVDPGDLHCSKYKGE